MMRQRQYRRGDPVIFRVTKHSYSPGPRARNVFPAQNGDSYRYAVDKFWTVAEELGDNVLLLRTRRGKIHRIHAHDPQLRHATLWERVRYGARFPQLDLVETPQPKASH